MMNCTLCQRITDPYCGGPLPEAWDVLCGYCSDAKLGGLYDRIAALETKLWAAETTNGLVPIEVRMAVEKEREACAKLADTEERACESHLRACKLMRKKGIQHQAGSQIARAIATFIRRRSEP
jgi:hypothetical protein